MRFLYSCLYTTIRKTTNQSTASNNLKIKTVDTQNKRRVGRGKMVFFFLRNNTTTSITSFTTCYYQTWRDILGSPPSPSIFFLFPKKKPFAENMTSGLRICPLHLLNFKLFWRPTGETAERHEKLHHCQRVVKNKKQNGTDLVHLFFYSSHCCNIYFLLSPFILFFNNPKKKREKGSPFSTMIKYKRVQVVGG